MLSVMQSFRAEDPAATDKFGRRFMRGGESALLGIRGGDAVLLGLAGCAVVDDILLWLRVVLRKVMVMAND